MTYKPRVEIILSITPINQNSVITTEEDHSYVIGNTVGFIIPQAFGMVELNKIEANILAITSDTLTIDVDTRFFTDFSIPASFYTPAQVIPIGSTNFGFTVQGTVPDPVTISGAYRVNN